MAKSWKPIKEGQVQIVYQCTDSDCTCDKKEAWVEPAWHQDNGTPVCEGDRDMTYMRTVVVDDDDNPSDSLVVVVVEGEEE